MKNQNQLTNDLQAVKKTKFME